MMTVIRQVTLVLALVLVATWFVVAPVSAQDQTTGSQSVDSSASTQLDPTASPPPGPPPGPPPPKPKKCPTPPCGPTQ
jgi:hypothetical protein